MENDYDVIIIGGGVVGCMVARFLSRYQLRLLLIEKEADIGSVTSCANSAVVHAGYDAVPGSLKALTNVAASPMWDQLAAELSIPYDRRGDYVVATNAEESQTLMGLLERGIKNGVPGLEIISADEMRKREPLITSTVTHALWSPTGGICDPFAITVAAGENAVMNGATVLLETAFTGFIMQGQKITGIHTNRGDFTCRWVVNAAGLYSDDVMHAAGVRPEFFIHPRRGEYCLIDKLDFSLQTVLFPTPTSKGKGILVTATLHGNTMFGPNANFVESKEEKTISKEGIEEVWQGALKLIPELNRRHIIANFSGLRAHGNAPCYTSGVDYNEDFIIEIPEKVQGLVNIGGIESPGLSAAPAIAMRVIELIKDAGEKLVEKQDWNPIRPARPVFRHLTHEQRGALIKQNPDYARVVCRCEMVTEGEILAEIHAPIPARTYDAIKRRTWLGTGRCQGGFDMPRVVQILARELGVTPEEVSKKGSGSEFLFRRTKDVKEAA